MNNALVLSTGNRWESKDYATHTELLEEGERIIGFKSRADPWNSDIAFHLDFQLIIGRLV